MDLFSNLQLLHEAAISVLVATIYGRWRTITPNRYGCRIPVSSNWNIQLLKSLLADYEDLEVVEWLTYGFTISRDDNFPDPTQANTNHKRATAFPKFIDKYLETEISLGATMGPFILPPFISRIVISPMLTREKWEYTDRCVILDLSFPFGASINDWIDKNSYYSTPIKLTYPTVDSLAHRIVQLGKGCLLRESAQTSIA